VAKHVMVVGPAREAACVVASLREHSLEAWSDRLGRVALDFASFDWADALVVIDTTPHLECEHVRPIVNFDGPKVLLASAPLGADDRSRLIERGFDAVEAWPASPLLLAARIRRLLAPAVASRVDRVGA
jgi:hypothetical protein